ncbi:pre-mRNA 3'-end-processing factor FIP1 [Geosmithia morbida]|uniref:Pre-mRNA 3'-end-processing factor FIP1 n=1 Tax=Geosmithia morbida TaxID=1094350 RepID=A0A9P4Z0X6_9HYPO|nr:pre-mRNA 3'-end-processing factor FIP1 [Geosmithia morbida]KAF4125392.1 pre-mRNA 3'-end-processing factor FIP1 [Geosmithia morbida]
MDIEDEDDFYAPEEPKVPAEDEKKRDGPQQPTKTDELEEGEEEDEGAMDEDEEDDDDDSDIDIITERKDGTVAAPQADIRNIPQRSTADGTASPAASASGEVKIKSSGGAAANVAAPSADNTSAAASKSTVKIDDDPIYPPTGKPITQVNIDQDLTDNEKPWRKPGTDISDYFNYGFDEFTWALYAAKQENIRSEFGADAFANNSKKMMDEFNAMMMGGMGMGGAGGPGAGGGGGGMDGSMPPEMQQMMQQMMASGMDPSQMDPEQRSDGR